MNGWLAVSGKGDAVGCFSDGFHLYELLFERQGYLAAGGQRCRLILVVGRKAAFAINAIERAHLLVYRQQVDAQRHPQTPAAHRPKYEFIKKKSRHGLWFL